MIQSIEHVAVVADDPRALAEWYCETLGFEMVVSREESQTYFIGLSGGGVLEILPSNQSGRTDHDARDAGIRHIALTVDNFDAVHQRLPERGVVFAGPKLELPDGTQMDFFPDPEGNFLQLIRRPQALGK